MARSNVFIFKNNDVSDGDVSSDAALDFSPSDSPQSLPVFDARTAGFGASISPAAAGPTGAARLAAAGALVGSSSISKIASLAPTLIVGPGLPVSLIAIIEASSLTSKYEVNGSISYSSMLSILQSEASGGMSLLKFDTLRDIASMLNVNGGVKTSAYVQQITNDVVDGNSANAYWNGGSSTATALGNLTATSSQTQVGELIGKWFLGTDLPSTNLTALNQTNYSNAYVATNLPLYGHTGAPVYTDVNQGYVGDCYFVASLAETALKNPSAIEHMITSNGNGTYSVDFQINGKNDYVTVNNKLPEFTAGNDWGNGSTLEFANGSTAWAPLIEKAYVELNEQTGVPHGTSLNRAGNAYEDIAGGFATALTEITGQSVTDINPSTLTSGIFGIHLGTMELSAEFASGSEVLLSTPSATLGNLIGDHMFEVTGINAAANTVSLQNPWNTGYTGHSAAMSFTETMSQLAADNCMLHVSSPKA